MHNHRSLFNMDISGGMPAVIIKMLASSEPGKIRLLPALPNEWPKGTIDGVLCRGAIEIDRLHWDGNQAEVELTSKEPQEIVLALPSPIGEMKSTGGETKVSAGSAATERKVSLPAGRKVSLKITLKPE